MDRKRSIPAEDVIATFAPERQTRIAARASELIAEELALRDIRKARRLSQQQVATRLGGKQVYVSRLEKRGDVKLSTLREYIRALGGELQLLVTFPEGSTVSIREFGGAVRAGAGKVEPLAHPNRDSE